MRIGEQHVALGSRSRLDPDAEPREDDVLEVACPGVGYLVVEALAPFVELPELLLVACERPRRAGDPVPRRIDLDLHQHGERVLAEGLPDRRRLDRAAASATTAGRSRLSVLRVSSASSTLKPLSPSRRKRSGDRAARGLLDLPVEVEERPSDQVGDARAERGLAGAHEADEGEVAV